MYYDAGSVQDGGEGECAMAAQGGFDGGFDGPGSEVAAAGEVLVGVDDLAYGSGADAAGGGLGGGQSQQVVGARDVAAGIVVHLHLLVRVGDCARAGRLIWRRRTGIEPARPRYSASPVLKTGEPTRNSDASTASVAAGAWPRGGVWSAKFRDPFCPERCVARPLLPRTLCSATPSAPNAKFCADSGNSAV